MTNPSRAAVGAAVTTGIRLLAALVGFSQLGGSGGASAAEVRAARAAAQVVEELDRERAVTAGCRGFDVATAESAVDVILNEIREAGSITAGSADTYVEEFYDYVDEQRAAAALTSYVAAVAAVAELPLLPEDQFAAYTRVLAGARGLGDLVAGRADDADVVSGGRVLWRALTNARDVCDATA